MSRRWKNWGKKKLVEYIKKHNILSWSDLNESKHSKAARSYKGNTQDLGPMKGLVEEAGLVPKIREKKHSRWKEGKIQKKAEDYPGVHCPKCGDGFKHDKKIKGGSYGMCSECKIWYHKVASQPHPGKPFCPYDKAMLRWPSHNSKENYLKCTKCGTWFEGRK